jgi:hypothetical protein
MAKSATRLKVDQDLERETRDGRQWFGRILAQVILLKLYELTQKLFNLPDKLANIYNKNLKYYKVICY